MFGWRQEHFTSFVCMQLQFTALISLIQVAVVVVVLVVLVVLIVVAT